MHPDLFDELARRRGEDRAVGISWRDLQPNQGSDPSTWNWGPSDRHDRAMLAVGVPPVFTFINAPGWALAGGGGGDFNPPASNHVGDYGAAAAQIALRYPQAAGIEIWLEPNDTIFWGAEPEPNTFSRPGQGDHLGRPRDGQPDAADHRRPGARRGRPRTSSSTASSLPRRSSTAGSRPRTRSASTRSPRPRSPRPTTRPPATSAGLRVQVQDLEARLAAAGTARCRSRSPSSPTAPTAPGAYTEDQQAAALDLELRRPAPDPQRLAGDRQPPARQRRRLEGLGLRRPAAERLAEDGLLPARGDGRRREAQRLLSAHRIGA